MNGAVAAEALRVLSLFLAWPVCFFGLNWLRSFSLHIFNNIAIDIFVPIVKPEFTLFEMQIRGRFLK